MTSVTIFRNIWKINAVLILLVGLLALGGLVWVMARPLLDINHKEDVAPMPDLIGASDATWELGSFEEIPKADYTVAPVYSRKEVSTAFSSKDTRAVRNYLFVNLTDKSTRWLLPNQKRVILAKTKFASTTRR